MLLVTHENKVKDSLESVPVEEIMVPKPRQSGSNYCFVCRLKYEDYLEHIESVSHQKKVREAKISKEIG